MARRTAAERRAEAERMRELSEQARVARETAEYPAKLMAALEEATNLNNYELTVKNGMFSLRDRDASTDLTLSLTAAYTENSYNALENLEWDLQEKAQEREQALRRYTMKQTALAKLSKEERELLGL